MKKLISLSIGWLALLALPLWISSCNGDEEGGPGELLPKLDGFYIYGTNTIAETALEPNAKMARAILDKGQGALVENMEGVYGKFLYIGANSKIKFAEVKNEVGTSYGATGGGTVSTGGDVGSVPINDNVIHGTLVADATEINVAEEGLYYAFANVTTKQFILMRVEAQMIGDATEAQWASGTSIALKSASKDSTVFEAVLPLRGESGYRYRFNDGWHVYQDANIVTLSSLGVLSYGTAWDTGINDIGFFLENIPNKETGSFRVKLKYTASTGEWDETKVRSYAGVQLGLFGSAFTLPGGGTGEWSPETAYKVNVTQSGNNYSWTWADVVLSQDGEFVILENGNWGGMMIFFNDATARTGNAFTNTKIVKGADSENFKVAVAGTYDIKVTINAITNARTLEITEN